jgi:tRNA pseudouridine55 synthase
MDGILNINKPSGWTSFDVVAKVRRLSGEKRVGHGGTLDPLATGVLPVFLGQATRFIEFTARHTKSYRATVRLGVTTDTYDSSGATLAEADPSGITQHQASDALKLFAGRISQRPPAFSAVKVSGTRAYKLARKGKEVVLPAREVEVYRLAILDWRLPCFTLDVECGPGTYIRSLANDLGQALGCGANVASLVRLASGPFKIGDSISMETLEKTFADGNYRSILLPLDWAMTHLSRLILGNEALQDMLQGKPVFVPLTAGGEKYEGIYRTYTVDGAFVGLLKAREDGRLQPYKVLARPFTGNANAFYPHPRPLP